MTEPLLLVTGLATLAVLAIVAVATSRSVAAAGGALVVAFVAAGLVNVRVARLLEDPEMEPADDHHPEAEGAVGP